MKDILRKQVLKLRETLAAEQVAALSGRIVENLVSSELYIRSSYIMIYLSFRNEVVTDTLITRSLELGKQVFVPVCVPETQELVISQLHSLDDLAKGFYNIREPKKDKLFLADRSLLELVVVPGAAFDRSGSRIGYGAGYYDRFFWHMSREVNKAALAFELQLTDRLPAQAHDISMDYIITENEIIKCR